MEGREHTEEVSGRRVLGTKGGVEGRIGATTAGGGERVTRDV